MATLFMAISYAQRGRGMGPGMMGPGMMGPGKGMHMMYNPNKVTKIKGKVISKELFGRMMGAIKVKTQKETVIVHLAPIWYLQNKNIKLNVNDTVEVKGNKGDFWVGPLMVAGEIKVKGKTIKLRNKDGFPVWAGKGMWRGKGKWKGRGGRHYGNHPCWQQQKQKR